MVVVAQLGARMHYAVPTILQRAGLLERLYTDIYAPSLPRPVQKLALHHGPRAIRRWFGRIPAGIPREKIVSFPGLGLEYLRRQRSAILPGAMTAAYLWAGREFCRRAIRRGLGEASCLYTYNSAGLELLQHARAHGVFAVMEQTIAPGSTEDQLLREEEVDHPEWEPPRSSNPLQDAYNDRERMEWETSDMIVCGSEFVRDSIRASGGPVERCQVIPYGIRPNPSAAKSKRAHRPLRVLTVGAVGLRKGAPYLLAAARSLKGGVEFRAAGRLDITPHAQELCSGHVELLGAIPRSEIHRQFEWADVFLLPTLCEGSATACYEALSYGLPVITTPNAGSVVLDGVDGFIVPIRDSAAIVERIERFLHVSDLLATMSKNALARAAEYTLEKYGERLLSALAVPNVPA